MKATTKLIVLGATGAAAYGAVRAARHLRGKQFERNLDAVLTDLDASDTTDLDEPVIVTEEVLVFSEAGPYDREPASKSDIDPDDLRTAK